MIYFACLQLNNSVFISYTEHAVNKKDIKLNAEWPVSKLCMPIKSELSEHSSYDM